MSRLQLAPLAVAGVTMAPGFALPFLVTSYLAVVDADRVLLGWGVSLLLINVVGLSIEANTLAECSRTPHRPTLGDVVRSRYTARCLLTAAVAGLVVAPGAALLYGGGDVLGALHDFAPFVLVGCLSCGSAVPAGVLLSRGRTSRALVAQGLRPVVPMLVLVLGVRDVSALGWAFVVGELVRLGMLLAGLAADGAGVRCTPSWRFRASLWQMSSTSASQLGPVVDRWFLTVSGTPGAVSAYEISDKVFFAGYQLIYSGAALRRFPAWGEAAARCPADVAAVFRRDLRRLTVLAAAVAPLLIAVSVAAVTTGSAPTGWHVGLAWAVVALLSLPLGVVQLLCARLLITLGRQPLLLPLTGVGLACNVAFDALFVVLLGPVGVVVSSSVTRAVQAVAYLLTVRRQLAAPDRERQLR